MALFKYLKRETTTLLDKQTQDATVKFKDFPAIHCIICSVFSSSDVSVFGKEGFLVALNTRQYLYKISPLIPVHNIQTSGKVGASRLYDDALTYLVYLVFVQTTHVSVGKMDIVWRTKFGEKGRIQTGQLKAVVRKTYS